MFKDQRGSGGARWRARVHGPRRMGWVYMDRRGAAGACAAAVRTFRRRGTVPRWRAGCRATVRSRPGPDVERASPPRALQACVRAQMPDTWIRLAPYLLNGSCLYPYSPPPTSRGKWIPRGKAICPFFFVHCRSGTPSVTDKAFAASSRVTHFRRTSRHGMRVARPDIDRCRRHLHRSAATTVAGDMLFAVSARRSQIGLPPCILARCANGASPRLARDAAFVRRKNGWGWYRSCGRSAHDRDATDTDPACGRPPAFAGRVCGCARFTCRPGVMRAPDAGCGAAVTAMAARGRHTAWAKPRITDQPTLSRGSMASSFSSSAWHSSWSPRRRRMKARALSEKA